MKPPFPEKDEKTLQMFLRECPPLYQVEQCQPRECLDESPFNRVIFIFEFSMDRINDLLKSYNFWRIR